MASGDDDLDFAADLEAVLDNDGAQPLEQEKPEGETESERLYRREGRRFVPKAEEKAAAETPESDALAKPEGEKPAAKPWRPTWYKDEFGPWDKLSENFRNALRDQERNASQAIEKHSTAAKTWEPVLEKFKPYENDLRQMGVTPQQYVDYLVEGQKYILTNPVEGINWLIQEHFGTDIYGLANALYDQQYQPQRIDPMQQQLVALQNQVQSLLNAPQQQAQTQIQQEIADWSRDKPDFEALKPLMTAIANQRPDISTLDELYREAQWAHPQTRERILKEQEDKRIAEAKRARAAGAQSPRGVPSPNGTHRTPKKKGWDIEGDVAEALDELGL